MHFAVHQTCLNFMKLMDFCEKHKADASFKNEVDTLPPTILSGETPPNTRPRARPDGVPAALGARAPELQRLARERLEHSWRERKPTLHGRAVALALHVRTVARARSRCR